MASLLDENKSLLNQITNAKNGVPLKNSLSLMVNEVNDFYTA